MPKSNVVAIALAVFAVVTAATGTAVAVTVSHVTLNDPVVTGRAARIDSYGRLNTIDPTSNYSYSTLLNVGAPSDNFLTSPTTASLALTSVTLSHPGQVAGTANTNLRVLLYKAASSSKTSCVPTSYKVLNAWNLEPGKDISFTPGAPLVVRATGTTPYCLDLFVYTITGSAYGASYYPFGSATWFVADGSYSGTGSTTQALTPAQVRRRAASHGDR